MYLYQRPTAHFLRHVSQFNTARLFHRLKASGSDYLDLDNIACNSKLLFRYQQQHE